MKTLIVVLCMLYTAHSFAQTYADEALLFSRTTTAGTARTTGTGGAFGAVGADLGSVSINPAGLGLYRSTDFSITPAFYVSHNRAAFNSTSTSANSSRIFLNQAGVSFTKLFATSTNRNQLSFSAAKPTALSFSINYQRQNIFERKQIFEGMNYRNSAISFITARANSANSLETNDYPLSVLAYNLYLINQDSLTGAFISSVSAPVNQQGQIVTRGANDQIDIALGLNVGDKVYIGAGMGISILTHTYNTEFNELATPDTATLFNNYKVSSTLRNTGLGINSKFGVLYRPASWLRLGLAYHIPTFYNVTENYTVDMYANYDTANLSIGASGNPFRYKWRSPMKGIVSACFFLKEHGFLSVDYEFLNYGSIRYNFGKDYLPISEQVNQDIKNRYKFGHVVRVGVEGAIKTFRVRGGYSFQSTPYKNPVVRQGYNDNRHAVSLGLGYRGRRFYIDFAYLLALSKNTAYPYADFVVQNKVTAHQGLITVGWKMIKNTEPSTKPAKVEKKNRMHF